MASTRRIGSLAIALVLCVVILRTADATPFSSADARGVVEKSIDLISRNYVFPEARAGIVATLKANEAAGRYDVSDAGTLVERLSPDLAAAARMTSLCSREGLTTRATKSFASYPATCAT